MEKTVLVVVGNQLSASSCGQDISLELSQGVKVSKGPSARTISRSVWTCCVEAVSEYCRVVLDLFPDQYQVCVAAVDKTKCQPINSWRDEDQDINKVKLTCCKPHILIFLTCLRCNLVSKRLGIPCFSQFRGVGVAQRT